MQKLASIQIKLTKSIVYLCQLRMKYNMQERYFLQKEKADVDGLGAFSVDGKMIDQPIITRALKIIEKAKG